MTGTHEAARESTCEGGPAHDCRACPDREECYGDVLYHQE
jgi:hypothetical protein